jgi:hypothetical protein
MPIKYKIIELS